MNSPQTIKCVIIDDDPLAIKVIENYLGQMEGFEVTQTFENPVKAFGTIEIIKPDIIFLDINMPMLNGLDLVRSLENPPAIIFTTAYREYAVEGFEVDATDYLVKPISFKRFLQAIRKAQKHIAPQEDKEATNNTKSERNIPFEQQYTFFKVDKKMVKVYLKDIEFIESLKDYIKIITNEEALIVYHTLTGITEVLPSSKFIRIHRSYTIGVNHIQALEGNFVVVAGKELPIGRNHQQEVKEMILKLGAL